MIIVLLAVSAAGWLFVHLIQSRNRAGSVMIVTPDEEFSVPLKDTTLILNGPLGDTEVRIENSEVWITHAPCPNKLCAKQGRISTPGQSLVCLPNRVVITILGRTSTDAVTY